MIHCITVYLPKYLEGIPILEVVLPTLQVSVVSECVSMEVQPKGEKTLQVSFLALSFEELLSLTFGKLNDSQTAAIADFVMTLKMESEA